jgi:hypothetical protein
LTEDLDNPVDGKKEVEIAESGIGQDDERIENASTKTIKRKITGVEIYDYVLAGISGLEFAWQLFKKLSGNSTREWIWVLVPLFLVFGLLQHKTIYRVICSVLLFGSILLSFILVGMISSY